MEMLIGTENKKEPLSPKVKKYDTVTQKQIPAGIAFVPSVVELIMAGEVIKDMI